MASLLSPRRVPGPLCRVARPLVALLFILIGISSAAAQTTRTEEHAKQQEDKAKSVRPYVPNWFERTMVNIEKAGGFGVARGFLVAFGDIKRGSGIALGPAYAKTLNSGAVVSTKAVYSIRNFKLLQAAVQSPLLAGGRLIFLGRARWQDAPTLAVYPLGPDSPKTRTDYAERKTEVSGQAWFTPVHLLRFGAGSGIERLQTTFGLHPPGESPFSAQNMPGVDADPNYLHSFASAAIDSRPGLGYSRSGTLLQGTLHDYRQQNSGPYSFRRVDGVAQQLIPILHGNWVIDLSLRGTTTTTQAGDTVPFFMMPDLASGNTLRGYANYRFRDRNSLLFTAEYRWYVQEYADMAIFYDAGKVEPTRGALDFNRLKDDVGIGFRLHSPESTVLRLEIARSREGLSFIIAFGAVLE